MMSAMAIFNGSDPGRYFDLQYKNIQKGNSDITKALSYCWKCIIPIDYNI